MYDDSSGPYKPGPPRSRFQGNQTQENLESNGARGFSCTQGALGGTPRWDP